MVNSSGYNYTHWHNKHNLMTYLVHSVQSVISTHNLTPLKHDD